ncbi:uncharacterized protein LOC142327506 [Lycorma delicatula]|uniref:uncharacterized protein LOC142327506 n=1 Tax=Lycorma delicatula TaxID=130591 RepID=UPI003F50DB23
MMIFLRIILLGTLCTISCYARVAHHVLFESDIVKQLPKPGDIDEHSKNYYEGSMNRHKNEDSNGFKKKDDAVVNVEHSSDFNRTVEHSENDLGHLKKENIDFSEDNTYDGKREVRINTPFEKLTKDKNISGEKESNISSTASKQTLKNGSITTQDLSGMKSQYNYESGDKTFIHQPDKNHVLTSRNQYDSFNSDYTTKNSNITEHEIDLPLSNISVKDSNDVIDSSHYNTYDSKSQRVRETPDMQSAVSMKNSVTDSEEKKIKRDKTDIVRQTPLSTLKITDNNNQEENKNYLNKEKESVKLFNNKAGSKTMIHEKKNKNINESYLQHENTFTFEKIPKLSTAQALKVILRSEALDNLHYKSDEKNEKEVTKTTPTSKTNVNLIEKSLSKYDYNMTPQKVEEGETERELPTVTEDQSNKTIIGVGITKTETNNDKNEEVQNNTPVKSQTNVPETKEQNNDSSQQNDNTVLISKETATKDQSNTTIVGEDIKKTDKGNDKSEEVQSNAPVKSQNDTASTENNKNVEGDYSQQNNSEVTPKQTNNNTEQIPQSKTSQPDQNSSKTAKNESNGQNNENDYGTIFLSIPGEKNSGAKLGEFITNVMDSDNIKNFIGYIKVNKLASNVIVAGPMSKKFDDYDKEMQNHADAHQKPIEVTAINLQENKKETYLILPNEHSPADNTKNYTSDTSQQECSSCKNENKQSGNVKDDKKAKDGDSNMP